MYLKGRRTPLFTPRLNRKLPSLKLSNQKVDLGEICHEPHVLLAYKPNSHGVYVISSREIKIHFLLRGVLVKVKQQKHFKGKNVLPVSCHGLVPESS